MEENIISLHMNNISKSFPGVKALEKVSLEVKKGEVHALLGENGAGKSTLMKVLIGMYQADEGEIYLKGNKVSINNTKTALSYGISMIHQEISLVPERTIAENIWLGREPINKIGIIDWKQLFTKTDILFRKYNIELNSRELVSNISIAKKQLVEIVRAISYSSEIIIMDEPTSALMDKEAENLFNIIETLKRNGISIIYISHKLDEIFKIADRITVLRDGQHIITQYTYELNKKTLITKMVGRELRNIYPKEEIDVGEIVLEIKDFTKKGVFKDINFTVKAGEILGISGLMGAGRTEIANAIFGIDPQDDGEVYINGNKVQIKKPKDAIRNGIAMVSEDRKLHGIVLCRSVLENISLANLDNLSNFFINRKREIEECTKMIDLLSIKTPNIDQIISYLSGGNQQKVVIAKWLETTPKILILDEPTRGIDVGAKYEIYKLIVEFAKKGMAIIMISSEMPEILGMSDRVIAISKGSIQGVFSRQDVTQEKLLECSVGGA